MSKKTWLEEAYEYEQELWRKIMRAALRRRLLIKGSTLLSLGGASALTSLWAACASSAARVFEGDVMQRAEEGAYKWSPLPLVEKYNWRLFPWGGPPYLGGHHHGTYTPPQHWDNFTNFYHFGGLYWSTMGRVPMGDGADLDGRSGKDPEVYLEGDILEKWGRTPDFTRFDFTLRRGIRWHDIPPVNGREMTAEDIKWNFDKYRTDSIQAGNLTFIERIEVLDRYTVRFYLKGPIHYFWKVLALTGFWLLAPEHVEGDETYYKNQPIGTGPFKVTYYRFRDRVEAVAHDWFNRDDRWPGVKLPFIAKVTSFYFADAATRLAAFRSGQIDYTTAGEGYGSVHGLEDILKTNPNVLVQVTPGSPATWFFFNHDNPALADVRVRRALSLATNRQEIIDVILGGSGQHAHLVGTEDLGQAQPLSEEQLGPYWQYNPELAKQLLKEAGYEGGLDLELLTSGVSDLQVLLQQQWAKVGVNLRFVEQESTVVNAMRQQKRYSGLVGAGAIPGYDLGDRVLKFFGPDSPQNYGNVKDPVLYELGQRYATELDPDERIRLAQQIHRRVQDQVPHLWLYNALHIHVQHPWLLNIADNHSAWFDGWGAWGVGLAWLTDTAPAGRGGRRAA